jgi:hypothetical protein
LAGRVQALLQKAIFYPTFQNYFHPFEKKTKDTLGRPDAPNKI